MTVIINPVIYNEVEKWSRLYQEAKPFWHVVIDNFLDEKIAFSLLRDFPDTLKMHPSRVYMFGDKYELASMEKISHSFHLIREELISEKFTQLIREISGKAVFIDRDFYACGLNQTGHNGFLDMHTDLNVHPLHNNWLHCFNVMIYLNKDWKPEYGGGLRLRYGQKGVVTEILPLFNRCVMMLSDDTTYHGYSRMPLPINVTRRAIVAFAYREEAPDSMPSRKVITWDASNMSLLKRVIAPLFNPAVMLKNRFLGSRTSRHREPD